MDCMAMLWKDGQRPVLGCPDPVGPLLPEHALIDIIPVDCDAVIPFRKIEKGLYKWDLAQFFTPPSVTDYIVDILNP